MTPQMLATLACIHGWTTPSTKACSCANIIYAVANESGKEEGRSVDDMMRGTVASETQQIQYSKRSVSSSRREINQLFKQREQVQYSERSKMQVL